MLLVEQNAARTVDFCERSLVVAGGRIRAEGSREALQRNPRLLHAYLGRQL
jgi:ABC-type branched-subunit amino acid transport system ATPase component